MDQLGRIDRTDILIGREVVGAVGHSLSMPPGVRVIEAGGRIVMPAFVDCHTHACWAGNRLDEWALLRAGAGYEEIARSGGGILASMRAVHAAPVEGLADALSARLATMLREGTTTVEVKSGYGLATDEELKMLRAIAAAAEDWAGTVIPTALIGHAIDPQDSGFVRRVLVETLPAVTKEFPGITIDLYCEKGAWSLEDSIALIDRAREAGHPVRVHADQFNSLGLLPQALVRGVRSIDHLEASTPEDLRKLAASDAIGVVLPCTGFHLDNASPPALLEEGRAPTAPARRYADARAVIDAGGAVALATNCNPGTAPCSSMPMAMALGVRKLGLTPGEAIVAGTVNAAAVLGLADRGTVAPGQRADLVILRHRDERELTFEFGGNPVDTVICGGEVVSGLPAFPSRMR